jgi:hypothetical protein
MNGLSCRIGDFAQYGLRRRTHVEIGQACTGKPEDTDSHPVCAVDILAHQALLDQWRNQPQHRALGRIDPVCQLAQGGALVTPCGRGHQIKDRQRSSQ